MSNKINSIANNLHDYFTSSSSILLKQAADHALRKLKMLRWCTTKNIIFLYFICIGL